MNRLSFISADKVQEIRDNTIGVVCNNVCNGTGAILENGVIRDCTCILEFSKRVSYIGAGIPKKYWGFTLDDLIEKFKHDNKDALSIVEKYCANIESVVDQGIGLYIQGVSGVAKTSLAFFIMKIALSHKIPCYGIRMSQLTKLLFESIHEEDKRNQLNFIRDETQLLLVDEIEKDYAVGDVGRFSGTQVNDFFSYIYDNQKALIVTSNIPKGELNKVHAFNIVDRLRELIDVVFVGESFRTPNTNFQKLLKMNN